MLSLFRRSALIGGYEHLAAILKLFSLAVNANVTYIHLISGEDYPCIPISQLVDQFNNEDRIWINCYLDNGRESKRWRYYWPYVRFGWNYKIPLIRYLNLVLVGFQKLLKPIFSRKQIGEFNDIYGGYIWGGYSIESIKYTLDYINNHPDYMKAIKWVKTPEERCLHTILANSKYASKIQNNHRRYWPMNERDWGPRYISTENINCIESSDALFVRKVNPNTEIFDYLKKRVLVTH